MDTIVGIQDNTTGAAQQIVNDEDSNNSTDGCCLNGECLKGKRLEGKKDYYLNQNDRTILERSWKEIIRLLNLHPGADNDTTRIQVYLS